jgi:predicted Rossmann fold nucleotide-binding protein DprA/Smf involved in DNA uptake
MPAVGLARGADPGAITAALAARSGRTAATIDTMLFGPAPASDAALVALADDLDALEREVRAQ